MSSLMRIYERGRKGGGMGVEERRNKWGPVSGGDISAQFTVRSILGP